MGAKKVNLRKIGDFVYDVAVEMDDGEIIAGIRFNENERVADFKKRFDAAKSPVADAKIAALEAKILNGLNGVSPEPI